jgi:eukaryotic-like serine/threonine-protein kinase
MIGTRLAHFEILEKIGAGGMGEVYKARDTRLNRLVAIKVLPRDKLVDASRKQRFIQEAQSASALNHPNIVTVHDINSENGVDYIVMEYIAGKTLDALIHRRGMPLSEVLRICIAVTDGLAKAHDAGIIHRDIKPSNLMVADDGRVKILDFGLAKLTETPSEDTESTRTQRATTEEGQILGTVAYMSPEQAEARKLDARSDIFSFGAVLYEMLTGRKAFSGTSQISTLSAVLREDPLKPENLSPDVDRVLRRCLRKDPAKRFQHMDDLRVALEELRDESESGGLTAPKHQENPPRRRLTAALLVGVIAIAAIAAAVFAIKRGGTPNEVADTTVQLRRITADTGLTTTPDLSSDGKLLAYASDRTTDGDLEVWVQPLTEGARTIRLTNAPGDDWQPSFSPDGGRVTFVSNRDGPGIYVVPAFGGDERLLVRDGQFPRFSPDGNWIAYCTTGNWVHESKLFVIPAAGGTPRQLASDSGWAGAPVWAPDSRRVLFLRMVGVNSLDKAQFWLAPIDGGKAVETNLRELLVRGDPWLSV